MSMFFDGLDATFSDEKFELVILGCHAQEKSTTQECDSTNILDQLRQGEGKEFI